MNIDKELEQLAQTIDDKPKTVLRDLKRLFVAKIKDLNNEQKFRYLFLLGEANYFCDRPHEAIKAYEEIINNGENARADLKNCYYYLGCCYGELDQFQRAIYCFEEQLSINKEDDDWTAEGLSLLGDNYKNLGQFEKAISLYKEMIDQFKAISDFTEQINSAKLSLMQCYWSLCRTADARTIFDQLISDPGINSQHLAQAYGEMGNAYFQAQDYLAAYSCLEKAVQLCKKDRDLSQFYRHYKDILSDVGKCLRSKG